MSKPGPLHPSRWSFATTADTPKSIADPPGYALSKQRENIPVSSKPSVANRGILEKQSWDLALSPGKSIFMNVFMLWMMGTGSGIFSILMVGYAVMQSMSTLFRLNDVFVIFEGKIGLFPQKAVYLLINLAVLAYLFNHAANMGLFPIHSGDWVASFPASTIPETADRAL